MNNPDPQPISQQSHPKIAPAHQQRWACIYVRQSTARQVRYNQESQVNQYHLVQRAEALGWPRDRISVIDKDLGLSGQTSEGRTGFKELVAEVSLGHVGIIFGYEVSRLARNNSDWYHLLDLAAVFGTLIADTDGVYDPRLYNDRLLLGLKGTMSEAELHLLNLRLREGLLRKVERGELAQGLPTGLLRLPDGSVVKDPDDQVRHVIELVFSKFAELGSARQVLRYLRSADIHLPRRQTTSQHWGEVLWKHPSYAAVYHVISNPAYAGAFVYGRHQVDPTKRQPGRPDTGHVSRPLADWSHVQQGVYPAYITWQQYLANRTRLQQNTWPCAATSTTPQGAVRTGQALLQGLVTCGVCGHRMHVAYPNTGYRYICTELMRRLCEPMCLSVYGPAVDEVVVQAFFEALEPANLDALDALLTDQVAEHGRLSQQWQERLKRAHYEAHLAERQFQAVDPDNRLVAAELERRWEAKLRQAQDTQEAHARFLAEQAPLEIPTALREQFRHISTSLPALWQGGQLSNAHKKDLLRTLISQVILRRAEHSTIAVTIVWVSGHCSALCAQPPIYRLRDSADYAVMEERIHELWQEGLSDEAIASQLTSEGFRTARRKPVCTHTIESIRLEHAWKRIDYHYSRSLPTAGYLTVSELAVRIGTNRTWILRHIRKQKIAPSHVIRHPTYPRSYLIEDNTGLIEQLRQDLMPRKYRNGGI